jgi:hypothetical protein
MASQALERLPLLRQSRLKPALSDDCAAGMHCLGAFGASRAV